MSLSDGLRKHISVAETFNNTIPLYFTVIQYSFTTFNLYSFLFIKIFTEYLFPKGLLIYQEEVTPRMKYFLGDYDKGVGISL